MAGIVFEILSIAGFLLLAFLFFFFFFFFANLFKPPLSASKCTLKEGKIHLWSFTSHSGYHNMKKEAPGGSKLWSQAHLIVLPSQL